MARNKVLVTINRQSCSFVFGGDMNYSTQFRADRHLICGRVFYDVPGKALLDAGGRYFYEDTIYAFEDVEVTVVGVVQ